MTTPHDRRSADDIPALPARLTDWLRDTDRQLVDPEEGLDRFLTRFPTTPQRRRWWRLGWPGRRDDASRSVATDVPSIETGHGRSRTMLTPIRVVAAGAVVALVGGFALSSSLVSPAPTGPAAEGPFLVAQDGSGDFTTITEAVAAASDGDTILIAPGTYSEAIWTDKNISLMGDGPRDDIIITTPPAGTGFTRAFGDVNDDEIPDEIFAVWLQGSFGSVTNLTFRGDDAGILVSRGEVRLEGLHFDKVGQPLQPRGRARGLPILMMAHSRMIITDSVFTDSSAVVASERSTPRFEGNTMANTGLFLTATAGGASIVGNTWSATPLGAIVVGPSPLADTTIEGNTITGFRDDAISVHGVDGARPVVRGNTLIGTGTGIGISVEAGAAEVVDNDVSGAHDGIVVNTKRWGPPITEGEATVVGNHIHDNLLSGVTVNGGSPIIEGNTIEDNAGAAILLQASAAPTVRDNTICGNGVEVEPPDAIDLSDNEICPDLATSGG